METQDPKAEMFRNNVRYLLRSRWLSQAQASEQIGVPDKWLRRLCHQGLERIDKRTEPNLKRVARFFDVGVEDLWSSRLQRNPPANWTLIKWAGSKRRQAERIVQQFPREIRTYWEPFVGSGAVLRELLDSDIEAKRIRCSDLCEPLVEIWNLIKDAPSKLADQYEKHWKKLQASGQEYFLRIRRRFNKCADPCDFFFLLRTCRIGFVEFNRQGEFTSRYHLGELGMAPEKVNTLLAEWHERLRRQDITFTVRDYGTVFSRPGDYLYLDPPYRYQKPRLYYGPFDHRQFFVWLKRQRAGWAMSLDNDAAGVPEIYSYRLKLRNGHSPVRRLNKSDKPPIVESLYLRRSDSQLRV